MSKELKKEFKKRIRETITSKANSNNPKTFWALVNKLVGKNGQSELHLELNGNRIRDPKVLAEEFKNFFINKVNDLAKLEENPIESYNPNVITESISFSGDDLQKALKTIKNKKCFGTDGVPLVVAKDFVKCNPELALRIFNNATKKFPDEWKMARILPLHKKGDKSIIENYRPISNLNSMSKIYEKLLLHKLESELGGCEGASQHGFRKNHSTTTAALELQSIIAKIIDGGNYALVYSVDLSSAFDLLRRDVFVKLVTEMTDGLRHAISDFLSKRKFIVEVNGVKSSEVDLRLGCVQGSTLGPRLFTLYTSKIKEVLKVDHFISYADDSYVVVEASTPEEASIMAKEVSRRHIDYLSMIGMKPNPSKTEVVVFSKSKFPIEIEVDIAGSIIKSKSSMKVLGTVFDHKLSWDENIRSTIKKCNAKLSVLRKIRKYFDAAGYTKILTTQFFSLLYYCAPVWLTQSTKRSLWKLVDSCHYRGLRTIVYDHKNRINREKLDVLCQRASPKQWAKYAMATVVMKCLKTGEPSVLKQLIQETIYTERRRPHIGKFYNNAKGKIGRQKIGNGLDFFNAIKDDWLDMDLSNDAIRRLLKRTFFGYLNIGH
jgi:hypothetical protein